MLQKNFFLFFGFGLQFCLLDPWLRTLVVAAYSKSGSEHHHSLIDSCTQIYTVHYCCSLNINNQSKHHHIEITDFYLNFFAYIRMVRILMATSIREAATVSSSSSEAAATAVAFSAKGRIALDPHGFDLASGMDHCYDDQSLVRLILASDRARTARLAAPALGLCFVGVGYDGMPPVSSEQTALKLHERL